ncbi:efflux transporter periplasmic adaptor subunit [Helicobacter enhydrae]|uniref:Efflux transporter periplasmic adaptor subunit n=2 Tax=Helicobacter enhydrae TaxID=222136 RepID=A0A1B1U7H0_9HELI|nr:efflux transporter periplasmic adaptor subunit [Helicobacter enhydrae]
MKKWFVGICLCALTLFAETTQAPQGEKVYAIFNIEALQDSNLMLDSSGIVAQILTEVGDEVKRGDVLLLLSNKDKEANIKVQEAQSKAIEQQYLFAKKQYERYSKTRGAVDRNTLDKYYFDYKNLESSLLQSRFNVTLQKELLNKTILKAPFDGIIASREIQLGDGVSANNTILFRLISKNVKMILEFDVKYYDLVKEGDTFEFMWRGQTRTAVISKIYPTADEKTRKVKAEALVDGLIAGTFGDGFIRTK